MSWQKPEQALRHLQKAIALNRETRFPDTGDRKSTRLNSSHLVISYAVFCLKKKKHEVASRGPSRIASHRKSDRSFQHDERLRLVRANVRYCTRRPWHRAHLMLYHPIAAGDA